MAQAYLDKAAPSFVFKLAMLGAASPLVAAGEILLGDAAVRGAVAAQPLGVLILFVAAVAAVVVLATSTVSWKSTRIVSTVVHLPSGARVTVRHG